MKYYLPHAALFATLALVPLAGCETQEPETPPPVVEPDGTNDAGMDNGMNSDTDTYQPSTPAGDSPAGGTSTPPAGSGANSTQPSGTQPGSNPTGGNIEDEDVTEVQPNQ